MKRTLPFLGSLLAASYLIASPVLSPSLPFALSKGVYICDNCTDLSINIGFRGDYVYNRHLRTVDTYRVFINEGVLTFNFWNYIDVYGLIGAGSQDFRTSLNNGAHVEAQYETSTAWGAGIRASVYEKYWGAFGTTFFGADGSYKAVSRANALMATSNGNPTNNYRASTFSEWQLSLAVGQRVRLFTPYIAAKWSNALATIANFPTSTRTHKHVGYVVGASLVDNKRMAITAEARFVDEKAATIQAEFCF